MDRDLGPQGHQRTWTLQPVHREGSAGTLVKEKRTYHQVFFLKLGNLELALFLVFLDGLLYALIESV